MGGSPPPEKDDKVRIVHDAARNAVLATAPRDKLILIERLAKALDTPPLESAVVGNAAVETKVFRVGPTAADVADSIRKALAPQPGVVVVELSESVMVKANARQMLQVEALLKKADPAALRIESFKLPKAVAKSVAAQLKKLYAEDPNKPTIVVDPNETGIVVKGSEAQLAQIRGLVADYAAPLTLPPRKP
jgi:type II secretory pathway component GspD/PulD (secretin)